MKNNLVQVIKNHTANVYKLNFTYEKLNSNPIFIPHYWHCKICIPLKDQQILGVGVYFSRFKQ